MSNFIAGSLNGQFSNLSNDRLEVLSVLINNTCNLNCKHCYLQAPQFDNYLKRHEWKQFLSNLLTDVRPGVLSFAGKEVFVNQESVDILVDTVCSRNEIQGKNGRTQIGVITNGTLLHKYFRDLEKISPDYWDVSVDGLPAEHDLIRGLGAFEQLAPNLKWLINENRKPVWLTHTVTKANIESFTDFISYFSSEFKVRNFAIGFYKTQSHTDQSLSINSEDIYYFTDVVISSLENLHLKEETRVQIEVDFGQEPLLSTLTAAGWANPLDSIGSLLHTFDNGLSLEVNTVRDPQGLWRAARITPEGFWLAAKDLMKVKEYNQNLIAKIRDFNYDAARINAYYDECLHNLEIFEQKALYR